MKRLMGFMMSLMLLATVILSGCGGTKERSDGITVYVSGQYQNKACYWRIKDNVPIRVDLTNDVDDRSSYARSIFVAKNTVYTGGVFCDYNYKSMPCYWKGNELRTKLSDDGEVNSIFVDQDIVYTAGQSKYACYWKGNASPINLNIDGMAKAIFVSNNKIYIAVDNYSPGEGALSSYFIVNNGDVQKYDLESVHHVSSIFVYNGIVYTAGDFNNRPCYWVGKSYNELKTSDGNDYGRSIFVDNGDIYILSENGYLWKNGGVPIAKFGNVDNGLLYFDFDSMYVFKDKIYIKAEKSGVLFCLILDKNGKILNKIQLEEKSANEGITGALSIFVTES